MSKGLPYRKELLGLQIELVKLQRHIIRHGHRILIINRAGLRHNVSVTEV